MKFKELHSPGAIRVAKIVIFGILCIAVISGGISEYRHFHLVSEYRNGQKQLEKSLQKDDRFHDVRVYFSPTRPGVLVFAPWTMPPRVRPDLERLVTATFAPLEVPVYYMANRLPENTNSN